MEHLTNSPGSNLVSVEDQGPRSRSLAELFHAGCPGSPASPGAGAGAGTTSAARARPNSEPSSRSRPASPIALTIFDNSSAASDAIASVTMNTAGKASSNRNSAPGIDPGSAAPRGPANRFAARNAITQPASEITSRTNPRHPPHAIETAVTP